MSADPPNNREIRLPPDFTETGKKIKAATKDKAVAVAKATDAWIGRMMKKIMPPDVFEEHFYMHKAHGRKKVRRWLETNRVFIRQAMGHSEVWHNGKMVGAFRVRFDAAGNVECQEAVPPADSACQPPEKPA